MKGAIDQVLKGGTVKQIFELKGAGYSERHIARVLGVSRNTVARYISPAASPSQNRGRAGSQNSIHTSSIWTAGSLTASTTAWS